MCDECNTLAAIGIKGRRCYWFHRNRDGHWFAAGAAAGMGWAALALDAPLFLFGPLLMPSTDYFADIGLTYAMIPIIAGFIGLALRR